MIQPTSHQFGFNRTDALANTPAKQAPAAETQVESGDRLSRSGAHATLSAALKDSPEIRPEVVERASKLAVDPNYPPRELILRLAKLMTDSNDPSEQA